MLHLFRNNSPFTVLILIIAAFIMKMQALSHPVAPVVLPDHIVFGFIVDFLDGVLHRNAFAYTLLSVIIILMQALFLNYIGIKHRLFASNTYFPAFTYLLVTSIYPSFNYFSEPLLINWLVLVAINMMFTFTQTPQPRKQIFNAGFMLCLPALIQLPAAGFVILLVLALLLLRSFNSGEWIVGAMGYFTPVYFFAGILFLIDKLSLVKINRLDMSLPELSHPVFMVGAISGLLLLFLIGSYSVQQQMQKFTIYIRRSWILVYAYLFVSLLVTVIAVSAVNAEWLIAMPALSLVIAQSFYIGKSKRFSNFIFYFSLVLLIFCQFALNK